MAADLFISSPTQLLLWTNDLTIPIPKTKRLPWKVVTVWIWYRYDMEVLLKNDDSIGEKEKIAYVKNT